MPAVAAVHRAQAKAAGGRGHACRDTGKYPWWLDIHHSENAG